MRILFLTLNFVLLITLGFFAKDNLIAELQHWSASDVPSGATKIKTVGTIEVAFSPNQGATASIVAALSQAKISILVSAYSFTSIDLAKALLDAKKRNVAVKLILDKSQLSQKYSSATFFINQGFDLRINKKHAIFHNKIMIIDDKTVITGSFNFTKAAETKNAENVLIIRDNPKLAHLYTENWWYHWNQSIPASFDLQKHQFLKEAKSLRK